MKRLWMTYFVFLMASCGFPGPLFKGSKVVKEEVCDTSRTVEQRFNYFCFDYDKDFQCTCIKTNTYSKEGVLLEKEVDRRTANYYDGRKKMKSRVMQYDSTGTLKRRLFSHTQTYGIYGRERKYREVEWMANGQKKITLRKGTKATPKKLEKQRYKGKKFKQE